MVDCPRSLLELFPRLNEVLIKTRVIPWDSRYQDPWQWYNSVEKIERSAEPLPKYMAVGGSATIHVEYEGPHHGSYAQLWWKCEPGTPLLNTKDFKRTREGTTSAEFRAAHRKQYEEEKTYWNGLTKFSRGDASADTNLAARPGSCPSTRPNMSKLSRSFH